MKLKVVVHDADEGGTGLKFPPFQDARRRARHSKNYCRISMKQSKDVSQRSEFKVSLTKRVRLSC